MKILDFDFQVICELELASFINEADALKAAIRLAQSNENAYIIQSNKGEDLWEKIAPDSQFLTILGFNKEEILVMDLSCYESYGDALRIAKAIAQDDPNASVIFDEVIEEVVWKKTAPSIDEDEPAIDKPEVKLTGEDGNIFYLIGLVSKALKRAGQSEQSNKMTNEVAASKSYTEALSIIGKYVTVV